jgi:hypothetical protein
MERNENVGGRNRLARALLAVGLGVVAISSLRKGKRLSGALAGAGALALGYGATTGSGERTQVFDIDATHEDEKLRCAICGDPIRPGQSRGPDANDEIVHEACK